MSPATKPPTPAVSLAVAAGEVAHWFVNQEYLHRARIENHIRRRLELHGVHVVDGNNPFDAGTCEAQKGHNVGCPKRHLDFEIIFYPAPNSSLPLVFVRRIGCKATPMEPGRWLLVEDGDHSEQVVKDWASQHMGEVPFSAIRWDGLRQLSDTIRGLVYGYE